MSDGRDSDRPREISKNGRDHRQDSDIRDLKEALHDLENSTYSKHELLRDKIDSFRETNDQVHTGLRADIQTGTTVGRLLWGLAFLFLTSLGGLLGYGFSEIDRLDNEIHVIEAKTIANLATQGSKLEVADRDITRLYLSIKELRDIIERKHGGGYRYNDKTNEYEKP